MIKPVTKRTAGIVGTSGEFGSKADRRAEVFDPVQMCFFRRQSNHVDFIRRFGGKGGTSNIEQSGNGEHRAQYQCHKNHDHSQPYGRFYRFFHRKTLSLLFYFVMPFACNSKDVKWAVLPKPQYPAPTILLLYIRILVCAILNFLNPCCFYMYHSSVPLFSAEASQTKPRNRPIFKKLCRKIFYFFSCISSYFYLY